MKRFLSFLLVFVVITVAGIVFYLVKVDDRNNSQRSTSVNNQRYGEKIQDTNQKKLPRNDIPIYPGGVVRYVINTKSGFSAGIKLPKSVSGKEVLQYYLDELPGNGWVLENNNVFVSLTVNGHKNDKDIFVVMSSAVDKKGYWTYVIEVK